MCERQRRTDKCIVLCVYVCIHAATSSQLVNIEKLLGDGGEQLPQAQINIKSPMQINVCDIELYDVSFNIYFHDSSSNALSPTFRYLCCVLSPCEVSVGSVNSECVGKHTKHGGPSGSLPGAQRKESHVGESHQTQIYGLLAACVSL